MGKDVAKQPCHKETLISGVLFFSCASLGTISTDLVPRVLCLQLDHMIIDDVPEERGPCNKVGSPQIYKGVGVKKYNNIFRFETLSQTAKNRNATTLILHGLPRVLSLSFSSPSFVLFDKRS